jgi:hypothetical protein
MQESPIKATITLSNPELDDQTLDDETRKLLRNLARLDEVKDVSLIQDSNAQDGTKSIGGALLGALELVTDSVPGLRSLIELLRNWGQSKSIEITLILRCEDKDKELFLNVTRADIQEPLSDFLKKLMDCK